ncbi:MAG: CTP synthase (glutamine hydrolyzing) [Candidatus Marsarchaeota archaeon]|nr:CTP synthase (glutamine hydrolyzing) [Candidatus Marsarchaeota archaeon]
MQTRYIVVLGSLLSGLGKGVVTSSICKILEFYGYTAAPMKFDGYLNYDCGTMNPFRHGEVFVLDDKSEVDMDFGTYERFTGIDITGDFSITGGKLFSEILKQERKGDFLGRDVQIIPHLTDLIIKKIRGISERHRLDFLVVEVGGTVGDIENSYFIEAMRQMSLNEPMMFINLTYVPKLKAVGEHKTKPTQIANRGLMQMGITPHVLICRAESRLTKEVREKLALFSNVHVDSIIEDTDIDNIYDMPIWFMNQGLDRIIIERFSMKRRSPRERLVEAWKSHTSDGRFGRKTRISIVGKYVNLHDSYASVIAALEHSARANRSGLEIDWIESDRLDDYSTAESLLGKSDGVLVPGGFGNRGIKGMINAIRYARESSTPYLGICLGMQLMAIEYAIDVCGMRGASSTEFDPDAPYKVVDIMPSQREVDAKGGTMRLGSWPVVIKRDTMAWRAYGNERANERHRHRYEFNNEFIEIFERNGMVFSGMSDDGKLVEIMEWKSGNGIGTQAHPEFRSRPLAPAPLFMEFMRLSAESGRSARSLRHD